VTFAPGTGAPEESVTVPTNSLEFCGYAGGKQNSAAHNTNEVFLYILPKTIAWIR
jgi:hypothetical protein